MFQLSVVHIAARVISQLKLFMNLKESNFIGRVSLKPVALTLQVLVRILITGNPGIQPTVALVTALAFATAAPSCPSGNRGCG